MTLPDLLRYRGGDRFTALNSFKYEDEHRMNINVTGIDPAVLLMELHNNTSSPDTWVCNLTAGHRDITVDEAREQLGPEEDGVQHFSDYILGRPIKAFLKKGDDGEIYLCGTGSYDRNAGEGTAQRIVNKLKGLAPNAQSSVS